MTWVIGANTPFGYGFVVSDVRVTLSDGTAIDCVQKVYQVGDFIAAGFAGSVRLGFDAIADLQRFLHPPGMEEHECWIPAWVAENWAPRARALFGKAQAGERRGGCSILMVGAHPSEDGVNGARAYTSILRSPDFVPTTWSTFDSVQSIGSGTHVEEYKHLLGSSFENEANLQGELMGSGGMAHVMVGGFMRRVFNKPTSGVSHHLQYFLVRRGGIEGRNYEPTRFLSDREEAFLMPQLARSWDEFVALVNRARADAAADEALA